MLRTALLVAIASAALATAAGAADRPITLAVVDTGVDPAQQFLGERLVAGYDIAADADGWHGTAVASVAAGTDACAGCAVMPVKALDAAGDGSDADIAVGIRWAVDHGARVVNLSLAGPTEAAVLRSAIAYAARRDVVVVAAAGNDGTTAPTYPAADPNTIAVAAVDSDGRLFPWSNRGRWVTVAASGSNDAIVPGGGSFGFIGTSSAAAVVSGLVGSCLSLAPSLTPALVRRALVASTARIGGATFGRVDVQRMLARCSRLATA